MRTLLLRSLFSRPVTVDAPKALPASREDAMLAELGKALETKVRRLFRRSPRNLGTTKT